VLTIGAAFGWMVRGRQSTTEDPHELVSPVRAEVRAQSLTASLPPIEPAAATGSSIGTREEVRSQDASSVESSPRVVYSSSIHYLQDFWGDKWPELRAELEKLAPERLARYEALVLTEDLVPAPLSELEDEIIRGLLEEFERSKHYLAWRGDAEAWPETITAEFLEETLSVGPLEAAGALIQGVQDVADSHRAALTEARREFFAAAQVAVEREARAGAYIAWPLIVVGPGINPRTGELSARSSDMGADVTLTITHLGLWSLMLKVLSAEYPNVHDLRLQMDALGGRRLREAKAVLSGKR
jgi:hypothetical protein